MSGGRGHGWQRRLIADIVKYYDFGSYSDDRGNDRKWVAMQNLNDGENGSDWIGREMRKRLQKAGRGFPGKL